MRRVADAAMKHALLAVSSPVARSCAMYVTRLYARGYRYIFSIGARYLLCGHSDRKYIFAYCRDSISLELEHILRIIDI